MFPTGWAPAPQGQLGNWIQIGVSQNVVTPVATVDFTAAGGYVIDGTYDEYVVVLSGLLSASAANNLRVRVSQAGAFRTDSFYDYAGYDRNANVDSGSYGALDNQFVFSSIVGMSSVAGNEASGEFKLFNPGSTTSKKQVRMELSYTDNAAAISHLSVSGRYKSNNAAIDGLRFYFTTGNIAAGRFTLYGVKRT